MAVTATLAGTLAVPAPVAVAAGPLLLSSDPFTQTTCKASTVTNHRTEVEPDTFSSGSTVVVAFQVGRLREGLSPSAKIDGGGTV